MLKPGLSWIVFQLRGGYNRRDNPLAAAGCGNQMPAGVAVEILFQPEKFFRFISSNARGQLMASDNVDFKSGYLNLLKEIKEVVIPFFPG